MTSTTVPAARRPCFWTVPLVVLALLVVPAAASAAPGWKLPKEQSKQGSRVFTSVAWHCGPTPFGVYRFRNAARVKGRWGSVIFKVRITEDGSEHRARSQRFRGKLPRKLRKRTRRVLRRVRFRYRPESPARVESVWPNGSLQASRPFNPVPVSRARC
ncbi:MAG: hypothetical protein GEU88_17340 [Solirubrobacterales bacterium]|nr:hypothetical protein [Solirubrobacterales bacterium]